MGDPSPPPTHVTITLARAQGGTLLRVRHTGFGYGPDWARARRWHKRAWITCLDNLEAFLADRPLPGRGISNLQDTWLLRLTPRDRAPIAPARIEPPFCAAVGSIPMSILAAQIWAFCSRICISSWQVRGCGSWVCGCALA